MYYKDHHRKIQELQVKRDNSKEENELLEIHIGEYKNKLY